MLTLDIGREFVKLRQLMLLEEFKGCLPAEIKTHLDERKVEDLHQATIWADDYAFTHKDVFKKVQSGQVETANKASGEPQLVSREQLTTPTL